MNNETVWKIQTDKFKCLTKKKRRISIYGFLFYSFTFFYLSQSEKKRFVSILK